MFTGIVEDVGRVERVEELEGGRRIVVASAAVSRSLEPGASVCIDGACLTAVASTEDTFSVEVVGTTLSRTVAGSYREGSRVNLERALPLGGRLEGHLVQGHVDGLGSLVSSRREGVHHLLDLRIPETIWRGTILHGSIAINGVSLTVNALEPPDCVQVAIIPHTWKHTNLADLESDGEVNVEGDLIGKYVGKYVESLAARDPAGDADRVRDPRGESRS